MDLLDQIRATYADSSGLDAKAYVLNRHGVADVPFEEWALNLCDIRADSRVLDVGCGAGRFTIPLARRLRDGGGSVVAVDASAGVVEPIRRAVEREGLPITVVLGDANRLDPALGAFDLVMANHMLYHLVDIPAAVRRMADLLRDGGSFLATTNAAVGMPELYTLFVESLRRLGIAVQEEAGGSPFTLENGGDQLRPIFSDVTLHRYDGGFAVREPTPVFRYYAATELYGAPMRDEGVPLDTRIKIPVTFLDTTERAIAAAGGRLLLSKPMGAFVCSDRAGSRLQAP